jgi:hypothetical protein
VNNKKNQDKVYRTPPKNLNSREHIKVGLLNNNFRDYPGPQRNRPSDSSRYKSALAARAQAYGEFSWPLLKDRVVSRRSDGVLYPLDGNSSNHWLESLFGPDFEVPCIVVSGLALSEENKLFQRLQVIKTVTPTQKYRADIEFDRQSDAFKIENALPEGFHISQSKTDAFAIGRTTAASIYKSYGPKALTESLNAVASIFRDDEPRRTNGALVKAIAVVLNNPAAREGYDMDRLFNLMQATSADVLAEQAWGGGAEVVVLDRMRKIYDEAA